MILVYVNRDVYFLDELYNTALSKTDLGWTMKEGEVMVRRFLNLIFCKKILKQ